MKKVIGSILLVLAAAGFSAAADVNVDVNTPNASIHVGNTRPQPAPVQNVTVIERERIIERDRHDNGKHKGHYKGKKEKKHKKGNHGGRD